MATNPNHPSHDWFEELCAVAAIGELSAPEFRELHHHLGECQYCRTMYEEFGLISSRDLGLVAADREMIADTDQAPPVDEQQLLAKLQSRAQQARVADTKSSQATALKPARPWMPRRWTQWRLAQGVAVAAIVGCAAALAGYRYSEVRQRNIAHQMQEQIEVLERQSRTQLAVSGEQVKQSSGEIGALRTALANAQTQYADLQLNQHALQEDLKAATARVAQLDADLQSAKAQGELQAKLREETQDKLRVTQLSVDRLQRLESEAGDRAQEQDRVIADLNARLRNDRDAAAAIPTTDEARAIFGARDLHIVDVYDVDGSGKTQRTYGRVYYVEKRLLVFYAFDLQDKRHNRLAAGFQAWGYREPNSAPPTNLGLFFVDDASLNRWVLKVDNPRVLERVDAVFVTLEPPGGSPTPRGRRLLYANLAGAPNHP